MPKETFFNLPAKKRQRILDVAIEAFATQDYNEVSVNQLVKQAKIAKGSFYQYFEDKADLYVYLLELALSEKQAFIEAQSPPQPEMGFFAYLRWLFHVSVRYEFAHPRLSQVTYRALYSHQGPQAASQARLQVAARDFYARMLTQGIMKGDVRPDIDRDAATFVLSTVLGRVGYYILRRLGWDYEDLLSWNGDEATLQAMYQATDALLDVLERGVAAP
ncbi:MAG: TetR/AcrR family transcriptional regulator [Anaerolineae bacterium]